MLEDNLLVLNVRPLLVVVAQSDQVKRAKNQLVKTWVTTVLTQAEGASDFSAFIIYT